MNSKKLMAFGETMVNFIPSSSYPLRYAKSFSMSIAGSESNVAIGISKLGGSAFWFSRLGNDEFGHFILNSIRSEGVNCTNVIFDNENRTGIMFKDFSKKDTQVFYYRQASAASHIKVSDIKSSLFDGIDVFFLTGITPVLSDSCKDAVLFTVEECNKRGISIAFDPNIRKKLWKNNDYSPLIRKISLQSQIVLLGLYEAEILFGLSDENAVCDLLFKNGKAQYVAIKKGSHGAFIANRSKRYEIPPYPCKCIESVGAGDGFNAGFLMGLMQGKNLYTAGQMGAVCGALATETPGDTEGYPDIDRLNSILNTSEMTYR